MHGIYSSDIYIYYFREKSFRKPQILYLQKFHVLVKGNLKQVNRYRKDLNSTRYWKKIKGKSGKDSAIAVVRRSMKEWADN